MGDEPHHECGFALLRLLKPWEYYKEKYGTSFYGLNRMYLMMEKQRNRGQDGCGLANVKLDVPPGVKYFNCEKSVDKDPIKDVFERAQRVGAEKLAPVANTEADPLWIKENVPFTGEVFLSHVRYGTDSENTIDRCHPVLRESNWLTRSLLLAGNFNITNNEDLFSSLVQIGQHPREVSDTVTLLEKIGHFVDKENNDLYVKYSATGQAPRTCFSLIAENINVATVLRRAAADWDGGYCIAGVLGHGDAFVLRDPCGIRPAFYLANDEVVVVASEAPLIQTVFSAQMSEVKPLPPGHALIIKRSGDHRVESVLPSLALKQCSFERIYFSRGNDAGVYREREELGRELLKPLVKLLEAGGDSLANTVLSFIPNTSELAYNGLVKEAQAETSRRRMELLKSIMDQKQCGDESAGGAGSEVEAALAKVSALTVRTEKVVHKDAKIRTFIQEDNSRESLTMHAYDVHYGSVRSGEDVLVALDDSIVRGNTLKNAILRSLDRLGPTRILVLSSCPQIRYPDVYGIDMAKLGDLAAFRAAITLLQERGMDHILAEIYKDCRTQLSKPLRGGHEFVNHVRRIYEPFTPEEISAKIVEQVTPPGCNAKIGVLFNTVEALHRAMPEHSGDWYFTGHYPTPGGTKVCCRAFVLWFEGSSARCYGVSSAASCAQTSVLVVGHSGSEHAMAWKISLSTEVGCVYVAPGNGGSIGPPAHGHRAIGDHDDAEVAGGYEHVAPIVPVDVPLSAPHFKELKDFCKERAISLVVVGSQQLLQEGLGDALRSVNLPTFGPSQAAAELDSTKPFTQALARKLNLPMVGAEQSDDEDIEPEVSVIAFSDGKNFAVLPIASQDHKRCHDDDMGPLTEGMGSFAPSPLVDDALMETIEAKFLAPLFDSLKQQERPFVGCLHTQLRLTYSGPQIVALKPCLGEPVAQALLPLLDLDFWSLLSDCALGKLPANYVPKVREGRSSVAVVMASGGYPGSFQRGHTITGLERALCVPGAHVFHSGTALEQRDVDSSAPARISSSNSIPRRFTRSASNRFQSSISSSQKLVSCGGRVLIVGAVGRSLREARERSYVAVRAINFTDGFCRQDIGAIAASSVARSTSKAALVGGSAEGADVAGGALRVAKKRTEKAEDADRFTYRLAGVDSEACDAALASFQPLLRRTSPRNGGQGSVSLSEDGSIIPKALPGTRLISSSGALGTKLKIAYATHSYGGLGVDLVAVCVNDIVAKGAIPLFFQDHFSTEKLDGHQAMQLASGVSDGCVEANCRFLDAGVAELPGVFSTGGFDLVGFAVGLVQEDKLLPKLSSMQEGDVVIGLPSSGLHCNGYSLVRAVIRAAGLDYNQAAPFDPTRSLAEALLPPTRIYTKAVLALSEAGLLKGASQVARGGLGRCFDSILPQHLAAQLTADSWELPASLRWLAAVGKVPCQELISTFNCGIGMMLIVAADQRDKVMSVLQELQEEPVVIGKLVPGTQRSARVEVEGAQGAWLMLPELGVSLPFPQVLSSLQDAWTMARTKVMVLTGREETSPLQALLKATKLPVSGAVTTVVATIHQDCKALALASNYGVKTVVLGGGKFLEAGRPRERLGSSHGSCGDLSSNRLRDRLNSSCSMGGDAEAGAGANPSASEQTAADFCAHLDREMDENNIALLVVLDDVELSLLTNSFLQNRLGKVIVVHASLLPAFPNSAPIASALRSGSCLTGCTVCFGVPTNKAAGGSCFGPSMVQEPVRIIPGDSLAALRQRIVAEGETKALTKAVRLVASAAVSLRCDDEDRYVLERNMSSLELDEDSH